MLVQTKPANPRVSAEYLQLIRKTDLACKAHWPDKSYGNTWQDTNCSYAKLPGTQGQWDLKTQRINSCTSSPFKQNQREKKKRNSLAKKTSKNFKKVFLYPSLKEKSFEVNLILGLAEWLKRQEHLPSKHDAKLNPKYHQKN
jgi:hypothetical protein